MSNKLRAIIIIMPLLFLQTWQSVPWTVLWPCSVAGGPCSLLPASAFRFTKSMALGNCAGSVPKWNQKTPVSENGVNCDPTEYTMPCFAQRKVQPAVHARAAQNVVQEIKQAAPFIMNTNRLLLRPIAQRLWVIGRWIIFFARLKSLSGLRLMRERLGRTLPKCLSANSTTFFQAGFPPRKKLRGWYPCGGQ